MGASNGVGGCLRVVPADMCGGAVVREIGVSIIWGEGSTLIVVPVRGNGQRCLSGSRVTVCLLLLTCGLIRGEGDWVVSDFGGPSPGVGRGEEKC